ncbi:hypothetical protein [Sulfoacidibacillus thermotolerans]|uniref:Uncharacterized protein n=1 Tax=Sulfoacidibacillus thermotolerans TaxID=1765684 RepID=A0A2U3DAT8_SULT2|nr:hypothetical protein [Sulfoacidibacillus thermotolerans]PWI58391.1 hypothetical protein BM613_04035 [Sulfoacidibacillus thermotolerans]
MKNYFNEKLLFSIGPLLLAVFTISSYHYALQIGIQATEKEIQMNTRGSGSESSIALQVAAQKAQWLKEKNASSALIAKYQALLAQERADQSVINQVNAQLEADGLSPIIVPSAPRVLTQYVQNASTTPAYSVAPPPVQAVTGAS